MREKQISQTPLLFLDLLLLVLRPKGPNRLSGSPDLHICNFFQLCIILGTVVGCGVIVKRTFSLGTVCHGIIKIVHDRLDGRLKSVGPVKCATTSSCGACSKHPVHTVLINSQFNSTICSSKGNLHLQLGGRETGWPPLHSR
jgi:hypothetical protein